MLCQHKPRQGRGCWLARQVAEGAAAQALGVRRLEGRSSAVLQNEALNPKADGLVGCGSAMAVAAPLAGKAGI